MSDIEDPDGEEPDEEVLLIKQSSQVVGSMERSSIIPAIDSRREIPARRQTTIHLGNLDLCLDWGRAPDSVQANHLMLQAETPRDSLIG